MKRNKKRGRPKITGQVREANGRISRVKALRESADQLAIEMRAKRFGLTLQEAKNPLSGTYIGRLCLQGVITQEQYDAAQRYLQIRNNYLCAKGLPNAIYDEMPSSSDDKARDKWVTFATERFINMQEALKEAQCLYKQYNLYAALQYLVIEDQTLPHLVNSLRAALNALHKYLIVSLKNFSAYSNIGSLKFVSNFALKKTVSIVFQSSKILPYSLSFFCKSLNVTVGVLLSPCNKSAKRPQKTSTI